ncbi:hypothetical protein D3C76_1519280 [compost metagenome]
MVGIHPAWVDHAVGGIEHLLTRQRLQGTEGSDAPVADTDVRPGMAGGCPAQAGEDGIGVADQPAV